MSIKVLYGLSREWRLVIMFLQRSHSWNYDKKKVEKEEKIAIVVLLKKRHIKKEKQIYQIYNIDI